MPKGNSGIKRESKVRGVSQSQIDKLRGTRGHRPARSILWETIQEDYARVGITITEEEAKYIQKAFENYSYGDDTRMRKAKSKQQQGRSLSAEEQKYVSQYDAMAEYCRVAPTIPQNKYATVHRGIKISTETPQYAADLMSKKVGDTWDVDRMPSSFSTYPEVAESFARKNGVKGIVVHMSTKGIKNSPSIRGISFCASEEEVMVADYDWKIVSIKDNLKNGGYYEMYVEHT